jgi:RHS repeat-associated protein
MSVSFDPLTNHQNGVGYDANGNPNGASYDVENRMISGNGETYSYDHAGKRVLKQYTIAAPSPNAGSPGFEVYFYGIGGQKLMTKQCWVDNDGFPHCPGGNGGNSGDSFNVYFGGKLVKSKSVVVATDRLGSVRANSNGEQFRYYPYGEERTSTGDGREKFGTYMRDNPGQDYADQRYYASGSGRFQTPDPSTGVNLANPSTWNKYAYVSGDPVNRYDPSGLLEADPNDPGSPTVSIGSGFLTGYGPEGPYTYVGTTITVTGVDTQVVGGGGTGSNDYRLKGLMNGYKALYDLWKGANLDSAPCQRLLSQLYAPNGTTGISDVVTKIKQTAYTILQQGLLFDGASSNTAFTVANFGPLGNNNPSPDGTVGGFFKANPEVVGLGQKTGNAIWIRSTWAEDVLKAEDTVLHEVLHKIAAGFSVDRIKDGDLGEKCFHNN